MPRRFSWSPPSSRHSSSPACLTAKAKSPKRARDFPPSTGSLPHAAVCCAVSSTHPERSTVKRPSVPPTQLVSPNLLTGYKKRRTLSPSRYRCPDDHNPIHCVIVRSCPGMAPRSAFSMKRHRHGLNRLPRRCRAPLGLRNPSREDHSSRSNERGKSEHSQRREGSTERRERRTNRRNDSPRAYLTRSCVIQKPRCHSTRRIRLPRDDRRTRHRHPCHEQTLTTSPKHCGDLDSVSLLGGNRENVSE